MTNSQYSFWKNEKKKRSIKEVELHGRDKVVEYMPALS